MYVVRHADDLALTEGVPVRFKDSGVQPARGVDLRSRGEIRLEVRAILDQEIMSGFAECGHERLGAHSGNRLTDLEGGGVRKRN